MKFFAPPFTRENIDRQFRELSKILHPDAGGSDSDFQDMQKERERVLKICEIHSTPGAKIPKGKKRIAMVKKSAPRIQVIIDPDRALELIKELRKLIR